MENMSTNLPAENQQVNTKPEENKTQRTFTQEEVNQIVSERLKREQNKKVDNSEYETRMNDLKARESKFACKEFLKEHNYPVELLDLIDTSDFKRFAETAEKFEEICKRQINPKINTGVRTGNSSSNIDLVANAFKP